MNHSVDVLKYLCSVTDHKLRIRITAAFDKGDLINLPHTHTDVLGGHSHLISMISQLMILYEARADNCDRGPVVGLLAAVYMNDIPCN